MVMPDVAYLKKEQRGYILQYALCEKPDRCT